MASASMAATATEEPGEAAAAPAPAPVAPAEAQPAPAPAAPAPAQTPASASDPLSRDEAIRRDAAELPAVAHAHHVIAANDDFVKLVSHCTAYRRLSIHLQYPAEYPNRPLHVELKSDALPAKLVERLRGLLVRRISAPEAEGGLGLLGKPQVAPLYAHIDEMVHTNLLLYATPEVRQCAALSKAPPAFALSVREAAGELRLRAASGRYELRAIVAVPPGYPADPVTVEFTACTFPPQVSHTYLLQAREIARRCAQGTPPDRAVLRSTRMTGAGAQGQGLPPPRPGAGAGAGAGVGESMSSADLRDMKHDVVFLKKAEDLRGVDASYSKQLHAFGHATAVRRAARRELRKLSREETAKELAREAAAAAAAEEQQLRDWRRATGNEDLGPQRSVRALVAFLARDFLFRLPAETSPVSGSLVFPGEPAEARRLMDKRKKTRPTRVPTCGCWWQHCELEAFLHSPPFLKPCPRERCAGVIVQHPDFEHDVKKLEKMWAKKQEQEREVGEVANFFGLDDRFTT